MPQENRRHRAEGFNFRYAEQLLENRTENGDNPAHDPEVIEHRDQRGHVDDGRQHPERKHKSATAKYFKHLCRHEATKQKLSSLEPVLQDVRHAASDSSERIFAERDKKHERADGYLHGKGGEHGAPADRPTIHR